MTQSSHLHKFAEDARKISDKPGAAPNAISASALDKNFECCLPLSIAGNNRPYNVDLQKGGWKLEPTFTFYVCENGKAVKYRFMAERLTD